MPMTTDKWKTTLRLLRRGWTTHLECAQAGGFYSLSQRAGDLAHKYGDIVRSMGLRLEKREVKTADARIKAYRLVKVEAPKA